MEGSLISLDWSLVRGFLAVADTGSLSGAARLLGISQPTLGRQVKTVEAQLGVELFHRRPKGFELTETGAALIEPARAMQEAAHRIALTASGRSAGLSGTVRITASLAMSMYHLPDVVADIRRAEPDIQIDLVPSDSTSNLLFREADIAVRMYRPRQLDLVTRHLGDIELGIFGSQDYFERRGRPETLEDLLSHDFVGYDTKPEILDGFRTAGIKLSRQWFATRCDNDAVYWELVRAGCGLGFVHAGVGRGWPGMEEVELDLLLPRLPVWLTTHEAMRHTPRLRRVWEMLADGLAKVTA
ncbi:LysR family transcriptional regulator [Sulfitobacter delicatus]|uniref:DNA-binding transcriptional regulator, LysR family n=1 Tax=Sulfitobacter delicatus TaxID=218672 RepID=A0A1G7QPV4_9RHOB|nr:LysR family transcriptional regulator [Sulfitobacter delicatus]SDG00577.1 DNA-binding transcriptional regulator, LysR family [Sulfitobacter delicatus]